MSYCWRLGKKAIQLMLSAESTCRHEIELFFPSIFPWCCSLNGLKEMLEHNFLLNMDKRDSIGLWDNFVLNQNFNFCRLHTKTIEIQIQSFSSTINTSWIWLLENVEKLKSSIIDISLADYLIKNLFKDSIVLTNIGGKRTFEVRLVWRTHFIMNFQGKLW